MDDLVYRLRKRAEIRRQIPDRKSVQEGKPDRVADLLEEAADYIEKRDSLSWVGLTDDELEDLEFASVDREYGHLDIRVLSKAIEAKLKEKNHA